VVTPRGNDYGNPGEQETEKRIVEIVAPTDIEFHHGKRIFRQDVHVARPVDRSLHQSSPDLIDAAIRDGVRCKTTNGTEH